MLASLGICWQHPQSNPYPSPGPGSITTTFFDSGLPAAVLYSSSNPPTLARHALALPPVAFSQTDLWLLIMSVRSPDKVPRPGDTSSVQRVEMMVRLTHEVNATVGPVDVRAFVHKVGILRTAFTAGAQISFVEGIDTRLSVFLLLNTLRWLNYGYVCRPATIFCSWW